MKRDLPIGPAEKFRKAIELGLREEIPRLDFDIHRRRTWEVGQLTEIPNLVTSFVFVKVEDDLVNVWRHTSVSRIQGAEPFTVLLHVGVTVVEFVLEEGRRM